MIILIGGEKGGTGKSTIATTLVTMRRRRGHDVLLIDTDPQQTSTVWAEERADRGHEPRIPSVVKQGRTFIDDVNDLASRYEDIVIDAGGRDSPELRAALVVCDRFYTPLQPSYADAWTLERMEALVSQAGALGGPKNGYVVLSRAFTDPRIPETADAIELLREYDIIEFSGVVLHERIAYRRAMGLGLAVEEMHSVDEKAAAEIEELYRHAFQE